MKASSKSLWWAPLSVFCVAFVVGAGIAFYTYPMNLLVVNFYEAIALAFVFLGFAYYFRIRPNIKVNRAIYVLIGITPIGLLVMVAFAFSGLTEFIIDNLPLWPSFIINVTAPYIIGALMGDWIGKRRGYRLPSSP
jgi:amino acid transporter